MATEPIKDKLDAASELGRRFAEGGWKAVGAVAEGDSILIGGFLFGVNPWKHDWESLGAHVSLPHPEHPNQNHAMSIYRIKTFWSIVIFATGELSANVWGFYVPAPLPDGRRVFSN
jgi:hypothetical protein